MIIEVTCHHCLKLCACNMDLTKYKTYVVWCVPCVKAHSKILESLNIDHIPWPDQVGIWLRPDNISKVQSIPTFDNIIL